MKRCIITGIGGFIGSHCLSHLLVNTDWEIIGIDSWRHKGMSERLTYNQHYIDNIKRVKIVTHDLTAPISKVMRHSIGQINYIINFASQSHVDRSILDPVPFVQNNVNSILNILEFAKDIGVEKFIQIGTDEVYGPTDGEHKHPEWSQIIPSNPYSASKACQDAIAISYWRTYRVPVILTNVMNQFGEMQDIEKFIPMVIKKIFNDETVTIHSDADRKVSGSRFWLHTRNTSDVLLFILNNVKAKAYPEVNKPERFNIVGSQKITNLDMAKTISHFINKPLRYELVDAHTSRPGHDLHYGLDGAKLKSYGYEFPKNLEDSLEKMVHWTLEHPRWLE